MSRRSRHRRPPRPERKKVTLDQPPLELTVDRLSSGGDGVARAESGLTIFIPFSAPGDRLRVKVTDQKRRFAHAEIVDILERSSNRVEPRCSLFGNCGGCAWQHLDYSVQVDAKKNIIRDALKRIAGLKREQPIDFTPSPIEYGYRVRTRMLSGPEGLGYRKRSSHTLCVVSKCPILVPELAPELDRVNAEVSLLASSKESQVEWELVADTRGRSRSSRLPIRNSGDSNRANSVSRFHFLDRKLEVSPGSFVQSNGAMHAILHRAVLEEVGTGGYAVEIYAGAGFFTLGLVDCFEKVDAIESSDSAVADLRVNLRSQRNADLRVLAADAEEVVPARIDDIPDCVLMDPPRAGASLSLLEGVTKLNARRIVYLSCDPATLARDIARLSDRGYRLRRIQGFDLFPQTPHVEVLASLVRE